MFTEDSLAVKNPSRKNLRLNQGRALILCLLSVLITRPAVSQSFQKPVLYRQQMHTKEVETVAFSNSAVNLFASGSEDTTIKLYEATTGLEIRTLRGHEKQVYQVTFSPDGKILASASEDGTVRLWRIMTGELMFTLREHDAPVTSVSFNSDGKILASGGWDNKVRLWDVTSGKNIATLDGHDGYVTAVAFSHSDANLLASGSTDKTIKLWNVQTGRLTRTLTGHDGGINSLAFSRRDNLLASGSGDYSIKLWDPDSGAERATLTGHSYAVNAVAFAPDGELLVSCGDDAAIKLWSVRGGPAVRTIEGHKLKATSLDFSPDGRRLISSGSDEAIRIWDTASGDKLLDLQQKSAPEKQIAISRDGKRFATASLAEIGLWTVGDGEEVRVLRGHAGFVTALTFSEEGELLASAGEDGTIKLWDAKNGLDKGTLKEPGARFREIVFSPDGTRLASVDDREVIVMWDLEALKEIYRIADHPSPVTALAFSRDGKTLACGYWNGDIRLWNAADLTERLAITAEKFSSPVAAIAFSSDGKLLASGERVTPNVKLWDAASGRLLYEFSKRSAAGEEVEFSHGDDIEAVSFSEDGELLISCSRDTTVKIWSVKGRRELTVFKGHGSAVKAVRLVNNAQTVFSGGSDGEFIIWRATGGEELARMAQVGDTDWLAVTPDGLFDGSPPAWRQLLWRFNNNTLDFAPVEAFYNEFFYPGLLRDVLEDKRPAPHRDFANLDRRQPKVGVSFQSGDGKQQSATNEAAGVRLAERGVKVIVEVEEAAADAAKKQPAGDVRDIRLFRNGLLVKVWHGRSVDELNRQPGCKALPATKEGGRKVACQATVQITTGTNRLSAYAFNRDDVKSNDSELWLNGAESLGREGTLYVLAIGVDKYTDKSRNLRFAVADIKDIGAALAQQQSLVGQYARTEIIELTNDDATKENILLALSLFTPAPRTRPPLHPGPGLPSGLAKIKPAQPEDALLVYFSGHGTAGCNENAAEGRNCDRFYLVPHDGFPTESLSEKDRLERIQRQSISDQELDAVLEQLDVGKLLMVIDACKSGQALEAQEKRRGPMNSKGLAQLAYEKGMYLLAASQSDKFAIEAFRLGDKDIRHGLLTYVLLEAMKEPAANWDADDKLTAREWIDYATVQVPLLQVVKMQGCRDVEQEDCAVVEGEESVQEVAKRNVQTPRVFYRREREPSPLVVAPAARKPL
jgi:WD40 repeat protein/uncharacterized caspase-like protein